MATQMTRDDVAKVLGDFLEGTGGEWDWDDFISVAIKDAELENIRRVCADLPEAYPPTTPQHYCNEHGVRVIKEMRDKLQNEKG